MTTTVPESSVSTGVSYLPEESPFEVVFLDVTHRCNMACMNCYVPNRTIPDMDRQFLSSVLRRLPPKRIIRLAGAEATVRHDLFEIIAEIRASGHHPTLLTNGLKLADRAYVRGLKEAGLRLLYLSFNGGFNDQWYEEIDGMACAEKKITALENLGAERMYTSLGMILVRGLNEDAPRKVFDYATTHRNVREFHMRSIGPMGRYMKIDPLTLDEMLVIYEQATGVNPATLAHLMTPYAVDFQHTSSLRVQITQWPDLGSSTRGRLTPEGRIEPFFEHVIANDGGY